MDMHHDCKCFGPRLVEDRLEHRDDKLLRRVVVVMEQDTPQLGRRDLLGGAGFGDDRFAFRGHTLIVLLRGGAGRCGSGAEFGHQREGVALRIVKECHPQLVIWHAGNHDNPFGQRLTTLMISKRHPDSAVPMSLLADHPNVQFNFFRGGIGSCQVEMH